MLSYGLGVETGFPCNGPLPRIGKALTSFLDASLGSLPSQAVRPVRGQTLCLTKANASSLKTHDAELPIRIESTLMWVPPDIAGDGTADVLKLAVGQGVTQAVILVSDVRQNRGMKT